MPSPPVGDFGFPPIPHPPPAHYPSKNIHIEGNHRGDHIFPSNDEAVVLGYDLDRALTASTILMWEGIPPTAKECTLSFNAVTTFGEHDTASDDISGVYISVVDDPSSLQVGSTTWNNAPPSPFFLGTALFQNGVNRQLGDLGLVDAKILKRLFLGEKATIECAKWVRGGRLAIRFDEVAILTGLTAPEGRWGVVGWDQSLSGGGRRGQGWFVTYVS
jgi:hypothetical protein